MLKIQKIPFIFILVLISHYNLIAQNITSKYEIKGIVLDSISKVPLPYATLALYDKEKKVVINGAMTNDEGVFSLTQVPSGYYELQIEFIGYKKIYIDKLVLTTKPYLRDLGALYLSESSLSLKEVVITTNKPVFENKIDRFVYNAEKDGVIAGDATDLMRKIPMTSVDIDGNVSLKGNSNVRILIDGKPSGMTSGRNGDLLQSIPASQIKNIEIITSASAKYDAEGTGGIINIVTKKRKLNGINGTVSGLLGTRQWNSSVNVNGRSNKLIYGFTAGTNNKWPRLVDTDYYNSDNIGNSSNSAGTSENERLTNSLSAMGQFNFDDKNSFSSTFQTSSLVYNDDMNTENKNNSSGSIINYQLNSNSKMKTSGFTWNSDYLHQFVREGEELSIALQWSQNANANDFRLFYSDYFKDEKINNKAKNNEYTIQTDYAVPLNNTITFDGGLKSIFRRIDSDFNYSSIEADQNSIPNVLNTYNYAQDVYAGYALLQVRLGKEWDIQGGNRFEITQIRGEFLNAGTEILPFTNTYNNYIPSLIVAKKFKNGQRVKISYNKRIQRPSYIFVNPFRDTSNILNQTQGIPSLSPELTQTIDLNYDTFIKKTNINLSIYYRKTDDLIDSFTETVPYVTTDPFGQITTLMVNLTTYQNIGSNESLGLSFYSMVSVNNSITLTGSFDIYNYNPKVYFKYSSFINSGDFLQYNGFLSASWKLPKKMRFETFYNFGSKIRTFQGTTANLNTLIIVAKKDILKDKGTIGIEIVNPLRDKWDFTDRIETTQLTQYNNLSVPFRSFNLKLSYKFGNLKKEDYKDRGVKNDDLKDK